MPSPAQPFTPPASLQQVPMQLRKGRGRSLQLRMLADGLEVVVPVHCPNSQVVSFLQKQEAWVLRHWQRMAQQQNARQASLDAFPAEVRLLGALRPLHLEPGQQSRFAYKASGFWVQAPAKALQQPMPVVQAALRAFARPYLERRMEHWVGLTGTEPASFRIKHHRSKWGSCSSKRNINLNWHLVLQPPHVVDYVVLHELMHLHEMNHSPAFWARVASYMPQHKEASQYLRQHQWVIDLYHA